MSPKWIIDSVAQGKLLPWTNYRLYDILSDQSRLTNAFKATVTVASEPSPPPPPPPGQQTTMIENIGNIEQRDEIDDYFDEALMGEDGEFEEDNVLEQKLLQIYNNDNKTDENNSSTNASNTVYMEAGRIVDLKDPWIQQNISTHPDFLKKFFAASRLHYLSTWKSDLQDKMSRQVNRNISEKNLPPVIFHVDMDCFFASAAIRDRPDLQTKPVGICHSKTMTNNASADRKSVV